MTIFELLNEVPIIQVAKDIGLTIVKETSINAFAICPFHDDHVGSGGQANLSLLNKTNGYKCFKGDCGAKGSAFDLFMKVQNLSIHDAVKAMSEKYGVKDPNPNPFQPKAKAPKKPKTNDFKNWTLAKVEETHAALMANQGSLDHLMKIRGLSKEYIQKKKIGLIQYFDIWNNTKAYLPAYSIPVLDVGGHELLAVRVHAQTIRRNKAMISESSSLNLYDLTSFDPAAEEMFLVEGEGCAWAMEDVLKKNVLTTIAGAGSMATVVQMNMAKLGDLSKKKRIVLMPDNDTSGRLAMATIRQLFPKEAPCHMLYWPANFQRKGDIADWIAHGKLWDEVEPYIKTFSWDEALQMEKEIKEAAEALKKTGRLIEAKGSCYFRKRTGKKGEETETRITNFILVGKSTLETTRENGLQESTTVVDIKTVDGDLQEGVTVPIEAFRKEDEFVKVVSHTKYVWKGTKRDLADIQELVVDSIPKDMVRRGVKFIGVVEDETHFVGPGFVIDKDGIQEKPKYEYLRQGVLYDEDMAAIRGVDAKPVLEGFARTVLKVNEPKVVLPVLGWIVACIFRPKIWRTQKNQFPGLVVFGSSGSGKTSFVCALMRIYGFIKAYRPVNAFVSPFSAMRILSCVNAVPVIVDELKESIGKERIDFWQSKVRHLYLGERDARGMQDQTLRIYQLQAPMAVIGETLLIRDVSVAERVIKVDPDRAWLNAHQEAKHAFYELSSLPLEKIFPSFAQWAIAEGYPKFFELWEAASKDVSESGVSTKSDRVRLSWRTFVFGLKALEAFMKSQGVEFEIPRKDIKEAITEIHKGTSEIAGRPKGALDGLLECLAVMATNGEIERNKQYIVSGQWLYIHLPSCVSAFRAWAKRTSYSGEILDMPEYRRQIRENERSTFGDRYVKGVHLNKRFDDHIAKTVQVDLRAAEAIGLDVGGFGYSAEDVVEADTPPESAESGMAAPPPELSDDSTADDVFGIQKES